MIFFVLLLGLLGSNDIVAGKHKTYSNNSKKSFSSYAKSSRKVEYVNDTSSTEKKVSSSTSVSSEILEIQHQILVMQNSLIACLQRQIVDLQPSYVNAQANIDAINRFNQDMK